MNLNRYDRQERVKVIGKAGQQKLNDATVLIAGVGALGSYTASQLLRAGVKQLILIDPDVVSTTNLQRQALFTEQDVADGTFKVDAAKAHLLAIDHTAHIDVYPEPLSESHLTDLTFDLVLDCLDNFRTRDLINKVALKQNFDYIFASCAGTFGSVMPVSPTKHACLNCLYPNLEDLKQTDCDLIGVNTALVPLVSGLQVSLALHYLVDKASVNFAQLTTIDNWQLSFQNFKIKKDPACPVCSKRDWALPAAESAEQVTVLCGTQTYSVQMSTSPQLAQLNQWLADQAIPYRQFKSFSTFTWAGYSVSLFKTGKCLLYGIPTLKEATATYQKLKQAFQPVITEEATLQ